MYKEKKNKQQERLQEQKYVLAIEEMLKQLLLYTLGWHFLQGKTWTWLSLWRAWTAMCGKGPQPGRSWSLPARQQGGNTEIHCPMSFFIGLSGYILNKQKKNGGRKKDGLWIPLPCTTVTHQPQEAASSHVTKGLQGVPVCVASPWHGWIYQPCKGHKFGYEIQDTVSCGKGLGGLFTGGFAATAPSGFVQAQRPPKAHWYSKSHPSENKSGCKMKSLFLVK